MKKKRLSKKLLHQKECEEAYEDIRLIINFDEMNSVDEKIRACVMKGNEILTMICENADMIKIDLYDEASEFVDMTRSQWNEFAKLAYASVNGNVKDDVQDKVNEKILENLYGMNLRKSFIDTYVMGGVAILPKKDIYQYDFPKSDETFENEDFEKILINSTVIRQNLNKVLWPTFKKIAAAAELISGYKLDYKKFKDLVDWEHYKNGGYPSEKSKPKLWAIFDKFDYAYRLMREYNFTQINDLCAQFGLEVLVKEPSPTRNVFSESARIFANYEVVRPICEDARITMKMLEDEFGIFLTSEIFAIYDFSTRVIRRVVNWTEYLKEIGNPDYKIYTTKGVKDSFDYLVFDKKSFELYKDIVFDLGCDELIHPAGKTIPNDSVRMLSKKEIELLGEQGYYGNGEFNEMQIKNENLDNHIEENL